MNDNDIIRIGLITKPQGLRGELSVMPLTDDPKRFRKLNSVILEMPVIKSRGIAGGGQLADGYRRSESIIIEYVRFHSERALIKFEGCDDADAAKAYQGAYISITADQLVSLKEDSYFIFDLLGCSVYGASGELVGVLTDVLETGSNDVYVVRPEIGYTATRTDILVPALKSVIKKVDISNKRIFIDYELPVD